MSLTTAQAATASEISDGGFLPDPRAVESTRLDSGRLARDNPGVVRAAEAENHALDRECTSFGQSLASAMRMRRVSLDPSDELGLC